MASVAGIDTPTWRATDNGLEGRFAASSGIGAALDEIGQCEPEVVANIAYMVAQGAGKQRAARDGSARGVREWCVVVFSTGEKTLAQVLSGRRVAVQAGQGVRFLDVPVTGIGAAHGAFGNLHGEADGAAFARRLGRAAERQSGHALAAFIEWVMGQEELPEIIAGRAVARVEAELQARTPKGTQPQAMRALATFARIAAAGELATQAGVTGWPSGLATDAAYRAWQAWLTSRDAGSADSEGMAAVRRVRDALQLYGTARFAPLYPAERFGPDPSPAPPDPLDTTPTVDQEPPLVAASGGRSFSQEWGHRVARNGEQQFWINDAGWAEIHRGHDPTAAAKAISARGYLALNEPGRLRMKARIPGVSGPVRVYAVRGTILSDDQPDGSGADTPPSTKDQT